MVLKTIFNVSEEKTAKLAVLIDADNASAKDIENILCTRQISQNPYPIRILLS